tara:strand:- start:240 stop:758 length:519 start_codon:yes stop_codon:yes gene_type:complete
MSQSARTKRQARRSARREQKQEQRTSRQGVRQSKRAERQKVRQENKTARVQAKQGRKIVVAEQKGASGFYSPEGQAAKFGGISDVIGAGAGAVTGIGALAAALKGGEAMPDMDMGRSPLGEEQDFSNLNMAGGVVQPMSNSVDWYKNPIILGSIVAGVGLLYVVTSAKKGEK